ncbi:MAG: DUF4065 domain-containing protein [Leptospiraceae bacterium]|nr:DUF4065 domain-containing protein [Leptospiraceae bacterium]
MSKLKEVILYILEKSPKGRTRVDLSKLVYYSDTVYFQRHSELITGSRYLHLEDSPQAFGFIEIIAELLELKEIIIQPKIEQAKMFGFTIHSIAPKPNSLSKEEIRIINKVLNAFPGAIRDENRQYPNLYESYVITPVYEEILISTERVNTKIHFTKKKSLLSLSGKLFRVLFEE